MDSENNNVMQDWEGFYCILKTSHLDWILGKFIYWKCGQAFEQAAQESGWVTIPGGGQKTTSGHGLGGMVVMGWWLGLMILEVFSNLNDSMILWK